MTLDGQTIAEESEITRIAIHILIGIKTGGSLHRYLEGLTAANERYSSPRSFSLRFDFSMRKTLRTLEW